jgi:hypothetical protein
LVDEKKLTVQDLMISDLLEEDDDSQGNETVEILEFMKQNGVPLTDYQAMGMFILHESGLSDIANYVLQIRPEMTPIKKYFTTIDKLTLADRIKGNAKLSNILKANANPANATNPGQIQPVGMSKREIGG